MIVLLEALQFVVESVGRFFIALLMLRFLMQLVRIPFHHQLGQFVLKMTHWLVMPIRKFLGSWHGYDLACLFAAWLSGFFMRLIVYLATPHITSLDDPTAWLALALLGVLELIRITLYCIMGAVLLQAVLSWTNNPYHPVSGPVRRLTEPVLRPIRRLLPQVANVDLSPLVLLLFLQVLLVYGVLWMDKRLSLLLGIFA